MDVRIVIAEKLDVGQPVEDALKGHTGFQTCQVQSQARVFPCGKRDVRQRFPEDVEFL